MTALVRAALLLALAWAALLSWAAAEPSRWLAAPGVERRSSSLIPSDVQTEDHVDEVFHAARAERQRHDYVRASELYDIVAAQCGNATSRQRQLRMWTQYQHADLLMRYIAPLAPNSAERKRIQRQAIAKVYEAVALSESVQFSETALRFRAAERVHAFKSMGLLARALNEPHDAIAFFQSASAADASAHEPLANLAVVVLRLGDVERALVANTRALACKPGDAVLAHNMGTIFYGRGDEARAQWWWQRTLAIDPLATEAMASLASVHGARGDTMHARQLLSRAVELAPPGPTRQSYRLQLALSHLAMLYDSTEQLEYARLQFEAALQVLHQEATALPDPMDTVGAGFMGYYAIYQGHDDKRVRQQLAQVYYHGACETLDFVAPHVVSTGHQQQLQRRRVRVGFLSGFLYDHSVGLLLGGVIRRLPRDNFEVFVITFDAAPHDHVTRQLEAATEPRHWVELPQRDLQRAHQRVAALELDILVFGEIGMHAETYFLAFARLARRSVQFWGHGITSGIATVDYFVSSTLFRRDVARSDQAKYTECLYDMDSLTTLFPRPVAPRTGLTRAALDLPSETAMPHLVLAPQTLYKLHPDFDRSIQRVLSRDTTSFLVLPVGHTPRLVEQLTRRWRRGGVVDEGVYKRIFFMRQLDRGEFLALCAMAALVLDPFPVGGGCSSLEVFSVGTPILALASRTTILQLTLGMYRRMGIDASCCVFDREDAAHALLRDRLKREKLRDQILRRCHRLYEADNARVVGEWQRMFTRILKRDAPSPLSSYRDANAVPKRCPQWNDSDHDGDDVEPPQLVYESVVRSAERCTQLVRLYDDDDPFELAGAHTGGDMLQAAFLGKVLWNALQRARHRVVDAFHVHHGASGPKYAIEIREGDDLDLVVRWQLQQQLPLGTALDTLVVYALNEAARRLPQHTSAAWREARVLVPSRSFPSAALTSQARRDCVALVITTYRRLALFLQTMCSLAAALGIPSHAHSSPSDRRAMRDAFPRFSFLLKTPRQRGHAASLNLALRALKWARFVLYVEDDWAFRASSAHASFLRDAVAILRSTPLVQVLLNDQHSGYATTLAHTNVSYAVHEFAVLDAAQRFAYWPGFSLNPGVWDLAKLTLVLGEHRHALFEEDSDIFERAFALRVWRAGLHVCYLRRGMVCDHIGVAPHASAYVLNGQPRRFD